MPLSMADLLETFQRHFGELDYLPLVLAVVLGGAVGLERESHGRPAGLRTHILVCLSATMVILVSRTVAATPLDLEQTTRVFDPNRMGAGIVTGIGFLGAATVLRSGDVLRGLTTAACIWYVAVLGIVLGEGRCRHRPPDPARRNFPRPRRRGPPHVDCALWIPAALRAAHR